MMKANFKKILSLSSLAFLVASGISLSPQANADQTLADACQVLLQQAGQLSTVPALLERLTDMKTYLKELQGYHKGKKSEPVILSTQDSARQLEATWGPIISTTTFSRELNNAEYLKVSSQILGFLSGLPQGRAIIASGGTMGERGNADSRGGGVGIVQPAAMQLGFKTLSVTAVAGFKYRAAPADFLLFSMDGFGSESRMMFELSKALVVIGGGGQAFNEATEFLIYNPRGVLVVIDDPQVGGSSQSLLNDERFRGLAAVHPNIIVAKTGIEAGILLAEKLGLSSAAPHVLEAAHAGINVMNSNADLHQLLPNSQIIGFSGWTDFNRSGPDVVLRSSEITQKIEKAIACIHAAVSATNKNIFYATAGNDPVLANLNVLPFETMVHRLPETPNVHYLALTASQLRLNELNPRISNVSYIASTWAERTQQLVARLDAFVTAGGNQAIIDQSIHAAALQRHQIHILGANTLTDIRIERLKNPNLKVLTPEKIMELDDESILALLGITK